MVIKNRELIIGGLIITFIILAFNTGMTEKAIETGQDDGPGDEDARAQRVSELEERINANQAAQGDWTNSAHQFLETFIAPPETEDSTENRRLTDLAERFSNIRAELTFLVAEYNKINPHGHPISVQRYTMREFMEAYRALHTRNKEWLAHWGIVKDEPDEPMEDVHLSKDVAPVQVTNILMQDQRQIRLHYQQLHLHQYGPESGDQHLDQHRDTKSRAREIDERDQRNREGSPSAFDQNGTDDDAARLSRATSGQDPSTDPQSEPKPSEQELADRLTQAQADAADALDAQYLQNERDRTNRAVARGEDPEADPAAKDIAPVLARGVKPKLIGPPRPKPDLKQKAIKDGFNQRKPKAKAIEGPTEGEQPSRKKRRTGAPEWDAPIGEGNTKKPKRKVEPARAKTKPKREKRPREIFEQIEESVGRTKRKTESGSEVFNKDPLDEPLKIPPPGGNTKPLPKTTEGERIETSGVMAQIEATNDEVQTAMESIRQRLKTAYDEFGGLHVPWASKPGAGMLEALKAEYFKMFFIGGSVTDHPFTLQIQHFRKGKYASEYKAYQRALKERKAQFVDVWNEVFGEEGLYISRRGGRSGSDQKAWRKKWGDWFTNVEIGFQGQNDRQAKWQLKKLYKPRDK